MQADAQELGPKLFEAVIEQAPDAIIYTDREGAIRIWNRAASAVFGYGREEVLGQSLDVIIPPRFRQAHWAGFRAAVESGRSKYGGRAMTTRATHKNGTALYVDLSFGLVRDDAGAVVGVLAVGRDGTERHRARGNAAGG